MAIKVNGTTVINDSRALSNIASVDSTTSATLASALGGGVTVSVNAPSSPSEGDLWYGSGSTDGFLRIYTGGSWSEVAWTGVGTDHNGGHLFTGPGNYTWTVPFGVTSFSAVVIGAGATRGSGFNDGANGGGLAYKNNVSCSYGDQFTITIASAGESGSSEGTRLFKSGVINLHASRGLISGVGTRTVSGSDGGGNGGLGGISTVSQSGSDWGGGGSGGAGGYSGNGGAGGSNDNSNVTRDGTSGSGGAGSGSGNNINTNNNSGYTGIGHGGGTAVYGQGPNGNGSGTGDTITSALTNHFSRAGSIHTDGTIIPDVSNIDVIAFGAGYGNFYDYNLQTAEAIRNFHYPRSSHQGACRIVWGLSGNASFPSNNVAYRNGETSYNIKEFYN